MKAFIKEFRERLRKTNLLGKDEKTYFRQIRQLEKIGMMHYETAILKATKRTQVDAFEILEDKLTDESYWFCLREIYTFNGTRPPAFWKSKFNSVRPNREALMTLEDIEVYESLPDKLTIYRGCTATNRNGLSWSLSWDEATKFAEVSSIQIGEEARMRTSTINKSDIIAYFGSRHEQELIIPDYDNETVFIDSEEIGLFTGLGEDIINSIDKITRNGQLSIYIYDEEIDVDEIENVLKDKMWYTVHIYEDAVEIF